MTSWANLPIFLARGRVAEAHLTANSAQNIATTTLTSMTGTVSLNNAAGAAGTLQVAVTVAAGRTYHVLANVSLFSSVAADQVQATILTTLGTATGSLVGIFTPQWAPATSGRADSRVVSGIFYATGTGTVTFTVQAARASGTGNVNAAAGSSIVAIDVGN